MSDGKAYTQYKKRQHEDEKIQTSKGGSNDGSNEGKKGRQKEGKKGRSEEGKELICSRFNWKYAEDLS